MIDDDWWWYWMILDYNPWIFYSKPRANICPGGAKEIGFAVLIVVCCALLHLQRLLELPPGLHFWRFLALRTNWTRWFLTEINTSTECTHKSVSGSSIAPCSIHVAASGFMRFPIQTRAKFCFFSWWYLQWPDLQNMCVCVCENGVYSLSNHREQFEF